MALVAIVAHSVLQLAPPYLTKLAIDTLHPGRRPGRAGARRAAIYLGGPGRVVRARVRADVMMQLIGQRIMYDLRMELFAHLQRLDLRFYDRNPVGRLMTRVTSDVDALNELFTSGVVAVFGDVFMLVGIMVVMLGMDWRLALVSFLRAAAHRRGHPVVPRERARVVPPCGRGSRASTRSCRRTSPAWRRCSSSAAKGATSHASTRSTARIATPTSTRSSTTRCSIRRSNWSARWRPRSSSGSAALDVLDGTLTLGVLVAFIQYSQRFFRPISDLSEKFNILQAAMASSERIFTLLDTPSAITSPVDTRRASTGRCQPGTSSSITCGLPTRTRTGCCATSRSTCSPASASGIVGATGSGKTTIINLLLRFYDVQRGRILVDGVDIRELDLATLRRLFGLVLQDVYLFSGTIAGNIRLGHDDHRRRAVRARGRGRRTPTDFIEELPGGYDAPVAERGATLSVGQKQLLSFARALAFDRRVLILDEATSSIDTETETLIREALAVLMQGRTTIAIAHRLSTIQDMDRILVLHKGAVRESGTHQDAAGDARDLLPALPAAVPAHGLSAVPRLY